MSILEAVDLYRFYHVADEEVRALRGVSLDVAPGELVVLLGASGSGKSTLLSCLAGLDDPDGGAVTVAGERLTRRPEAQRAGVRARHLGVMLQGGNLLAHLNVLDNVTLTGRLLGQPGGARALDLLGQLGLDHRRHAFPAQLSGGEIARASLAAALAHRPAALLADEPTAEVDARTEERVIGVIEAFVRGEGRGGRCAVIATHSSRLAARATRVLRLKDGRWQDA
ncbi:ABC transporter related protein [Deinococcus aerius]|uniref:ABC transporter related protein n=2 Tax=Deinococcus TaxID=1298 RepID=A0A2I9DEW3_9DEIO|nr:MULTISPECIES: ATP-binding cassette domain-containing protein [Deinococcus]MBB5294003.1 putative ABC transport system ATP-binding protein [Deinococcus metallilatus]QBY07432.1 ATP-binding cassette domain-containing protein [Deinococcus metallilatus]RXJ14545.1 ATP-binding cassette domain-containing protein [Deinococcus metallilatus]TLK30665.1 ATP-binding cassette domain-containing protein [Deinococcus metallilatus]GBF04538.1 ABC transporter related protein [Deinococcus aerius]